MRWYVSRNGETQGPLDEIIVADWVRAGMRDASVRDESGGTWMPVPQSPFASLLPKQTPKSSLAGFIVALIVLSGLCTILVGFTYGAMFFILFGVIGLAVFATRR